MRIALILRNTAGICHHVVNLICLLPRAIYEGCLNMIDAATQNISSENMHLVRNTFGKRYARLDVALLQLTKLLYSFNN